MLKRVESLEVAALLRVLLDAEVIDLEASMMWIKRVLQRAKGKGVD